jgi:hypothetical protein
MLVSNLQLKLKTRTNDNLAKAKDILLSMRGKIPPLIDLQVETDVRRGDSSYDILLVAQFHSLQDFDAYVVHPVHQNVARDIAGLVDSVASVCYEV